MFQNLKLNWLISKKLNMINKKFDKRDLIPFLMNIYTNNQNKISCN